MTAGCSRGAATYNPRVPSLILTLALFVTNQAGQPATPDNVTRARAVLTALAAHEFSTIDAQDYAIPSHVAEAVIRDIADFIKR